MDRIILQVTREDLVELDAVAASDATSRSAVVRDAIAHYLAARRRAKELAEVVASYEQRPPEDLVAAPDHLSRGWPS